MTKDTQSSSITFELALDSTAPLYFAGGVARVNLDRNGVVSTAFGTDYEMGLTGDECDGIDSCWPVHNNVNGPALSALLQSEPMRALFERVHLGRTIEKGTSALQGVLNEDAKEASEAIQTALHDCEIVNMWAASDWFREVRVTELVLPGESIQTAAARHVDACESNEGLMSLRDARHEIADLLVEAFGDDVISEIRQDLRLEMQGMPGFAEKLANADSKRSED